MRLFEVQFWDVPGEVAERMYVVAEDQHKAAKVADDAAVECWNGFDIRALAGTDVAVTPYYRNRGPVRLLLP